MKNKELKNFRIQLQLLRFKTQLSRKFGKLKCYNKDCPDFSDCYKSDKQRKLGDRDKLVLWEDVHNIMKNEIEKQIKKVK